MKRAQHHQRGSAIIWVFIAIGLFAALSFAISNSSRTSTNFIEDTSNEAQATDQSSYINGITSATKRLTLRGCDFDELSYETPSGDNENPNAPSDKSCHLFSPKGGQVHYRDSDLLFCDDGSIGDGLEAGDLCGSLVYIGAFNGQDLFTTLNDHGALTWGGVSLDATYTNFTDGLTNTDFLVSEGGYPAAEACRSLGPKWYLPAREELSFLYSNRNEGSLSGSFTPTSYWSSSIFDTHNGWRVVYTNGSQSGQNKTASHQVRCFTQQ